MINGVISKLKTRKTTLTALSGMLNNIGRPLISLITLPILLLNLGQTGLGLWLIALSLMALLNTINSGLTISLVTLVARIEKKNEQTELPLLATSATLVAALTATVMATIAVALSLSVQWGAVFSIESPDLAQEMQDMLVAISVVMAVGMVSAVPKQIMFGRMHGYFAYLLDFAGVCVGAIALITTISNNAPLYILALAFSGPSPLIMLVVGTWYLRKIGVPFFSIRYISKPVLKILWGDCIRMTGYQLSYSISSQSDLFLIGIILGAPATAAYGVAQRVFSLPLMLVGAINQAQWPRFAKAAAEADHAMIKQVLKNTLIYAAGAAIILATVFSIFYNALLDIWLGDVIETDHNILVGMIAWVGIASVVATCDSVLRGQNEATFLMRSMMMMAVINVSTSLFLIPIIGPAGAIWGSVTGYAVALLLPFAFRINANLAENHVSQSSNPNDG